MCLGSSARTAALGLQPGPQDLAGEWITPRGKGRAWRPGGEFICAAQIFNNKGGKLRIKGKMVLFALCFVGLGKGRRQVGEEERCNGKEEKERLVVRFLTFF